VEEIMENEIWVWAEHQQGEIREASLELLGEARRLAKNLNAKVGAVLLGHGISGLTANLAAYGADVIYCFDAPGLEAFNIEATLQAVSTIRKDHSPGLVLIAATPNGVSLAPRLAAHWKSGYAANAVTISAQPDGSLKINRATCLNKAHAVYQFAAGAPVVITLKPGSVGLDRPDRSRKGVVIVAEPGELPGSATTSRGIIKADAKTVALDEAEMVVAGGNGFRSKEDLALLWELAETLGVAVGGSKPTFDKGWVPHSRLVGQSSGRRLAPRLFIGVGVSGTTYFVEGMKDSRQIVAINLDKGAPLMKMADLAVVGDLYELLPELTKQIHARKGGAV
jgi:electron transfer flavoprotein alpha subunit